MPKPEAVPKIGAGHAAAMWRQGLSELRGSLYNESNVAQPPQYGLYGTRTPGEVGTDRAKDAVEAAAVRALDEEPRSVLGDRMQKAEEMSRDHAGREPPDLTKE